MNTSNKAIESYLAERNIRLNESIESLVRTLAATSGAKSGRAVKGIMDECVREIKENSMVIVDQLVLEKRLYSPRTRDKELAERLNEILDQRIAYLNQVKEERLKRTLGLTYTERILEASDVSVSFASIKDNAILKIDEKLLDLKERKGSTIKQRLVYELENNWAYIVIVSAVALYALFSQISG